MKILYYLTAHGYGHAVRSCAIVHEFSADVQVIFRTLIPQKFFEEEVQRSFGYFPGQFDCGCIQSDSVTVNKRETLETYARLARENDRRLSEEVEWCRRQSVDGILSDITPFAFEVARKAGLPSVAVTNFTWCDIYEPYAKDFPFFRPYLHRIRQQYEMADLLLELMPSCGMDYFRNRIRVPLVGRTGRNLCDRLKDKLGLEKRNQLGLIYTGEFGMDSVSWKNLERIKDWDFVGIYPLPGEPKNYYLVEKKDFPYQDLIASVGVMISKVGYGVFSECLLNGTPLLYLPRDDFAEFPVLERAIIDWGHGYCLSREEYRSLEWEGVLKKVVSRERPKPQASDGAKICAREIERLAARRMRG